MAAVHDMVLNINWNDCNQKVFVTALLLMHIQYQECRYQNECVSKLCKKGIWIYVCVRV